MRLMSCGLYHDLWRVLGPDQHEAEACSHPEGGLSGTVGQAIRVPADNLIPFWRWTYTFFRYTTALFSIFEDQVTKN